MTVSRCSGASLALAAVCALWSCSGSSPSPTAPSATTPPPAAPSPAPAPPPASRTLAVAIVGSAGHAAYNPNPVAANTGDIVTFRNSDTVVHRIRVGNEDLGELAPGGTSRGYTVRSMDAVSITCANHPSMIGSLNGSLEEETRCVDAYGYPC